MVDFNNEQTITTPPGDIVKILIIERKEQVIEALEGYHLADETGADPETRLDTVKARMRSLWYELAPMIKRKKNATEYKQACEAMQNLRKVRDVREAFEEINEFIDEIGLTQIDRKVWDRTDIEQSNMRKGL